MLIVNFGFYIAEDWNRALHTLHAGSTFLDWTSEFATSIDEIAWFVLLAMFELETYVLSDAAWKGWVAHTVRGLRIACYAMIAHTIYAFFVTVLNLQPTVPVEDVTDLCQMTEADVSYVYNLSYTGITEESCGGLSTADEYFWVSTDPIVSTHEGLDLERDLALADLAEAAIWLVIILLIEMVVRLQGRGITSGKWWSAAKGMKTVLYLSLIGIGVYWATLTHWLYLWDELVWIGGFAAIEMNVSAWRDEILEAEA